MAENLYRVPALELPSREDVRRISEKLNLKSTDEDIDAYTEHCGHAMAAYNRVDQLDDYHIEVKYQRTPGSRPKPEENKFNQWYWRCDIKGASSGTLFGKTVGIKDNVAVAGVPMMNGSRILEGYTPEIDATIVSRILEAGGRILGKTACEDLCISPTSYTNVKAPVLNPHNTKMTSGGSSSGSAVAVQIGDVDVAIGGDQAGSIRMPASFCGIVGLKPTFGLVSYTGIYTIDISVDHTGPMARNVTDCALLLEVIAGYDGGLDPRQSRNFIIPDYSAQVDADVKGKRVALLEEAFEMSTTEVSKCVRAAAEKFKTSGMTVEAVSLPMHKDGIMIWTAVSQPASYEYMVVGNARLPKASFENTSPFNASGHPALTINSGFVNGLPVGMMIVGKYFDELTVLQIARAFEKKLK